MVAFTPGGCAGIKQKPAYLLLSRGLAPSSPLSFYQSFRRFFLHTAIESSDQTKAAKHDPLVYRVEEIAQLLAISPRDAPKVNIEERTIWDEKTMLAALQTIENPALHLAVHMSMILSLREGNKSSLILKKPKTKKSNRILYMTKPLKEELLTWLEKLKQDERNVPEKYSNCGQLFRLPDGLPIAPELLTKWYRLWRAEHPEFEQIVFHGLRHSSATYQLLQSDGDFKSVQGNTGHATASVLMDTYAHTQDKPRLELTEKIEANFYSQDLTPAAPQPRQNEKPVATKISGKEILEAIRLMDADERRELTRALFA